MNRDLEVAENVLFTLMNEKTNSWIGLNRIKDNVEGSYLKDYGVIFSVDYGGPLSFHLAAPAVAKKGKKLKPSAYAWTVGEEEHGDGYAKFIETAKAFLADYGHLVGQLKDDDHIKVKMSTGDNLFSFKSYAPEVIAYNFTNYGNPAKIVKSPSH